MLETKPRENREAHRDHKASFLPKCGFSKLNKLMTKDTTCKLNLWYVAEIFQVVNQGLNLVHEKTNGDNKRLSKWLADF